MDRRPPVLRNPALQGYDRSLSSVVVSAAFRVDHDSECNDEFAFYHDDESDGLPPAALTTPRLLWASMPSSSICSPKENLTSSATLLNQYGSSGDGRSPLLPKRTQKLPQDWRMSTAAEAEPKLGSHDDRVSSRSSINCSDPPPSRRRRHRLAPVTEDKGCLPPKLAFLRRSFSFNALRPSPATMALSDDLPIQSTARPTADGHGQSVTVNGVVRMERQDCNHHFNICADSHDPYICSKCNVRRPQLQVSQPRAWPVSDSVSGRFDEESQFCCRNAAQAGRRMCCTTVQRPARLHPIDCQHPSSSASNQCNLCRSNKNSLLSPEPDRRKRQPPKSSKADVASPDGGASILAYHYGRPQRHGHSRDLGRKTFLPYRTNLIGC